MENCTIYSYKVAFDTITDIVSLHLPKAAIDIKDKGTHKGVHVLVKGGFLRKNYELSINYRERESPSYTLEESIFITSLLANKNSGQSYLLEQ